MTPSKKHSKKIPMKHLHLLLVVVGLSIAPALQAQYQQFHSMPYQGVARNASGQPVANQNIRVRFILQYGLSNAYIESQLLTTNAFGVFNAQIGDGTPEPATFPSFNAIDWWGGSSAGLQVWIDITGGTNYVLAGSTPLRSVPFATLSEQAFALLDSSLYSATNRVFMKPTARMGLGTGTPQNLLDVEGSMVIGSSFSGTNTAPVNGMLVQGNVGIGTTVPQQKLDVQGNALVRGTEFDSVGDSAVLYVGDTDSRVQNTYGTGLQLYTYPGSSPAITIETGTNNVGIGTELPVAKLDVAGNVRIADGTQGAGKVLTSDASGNAAWSTVVSSGTYTPTLSGATGFVSPGTMECTYSRVGPLVTVACSRAANVQEFGAGTNTVNLSLPPGLPVVFTGRPTGTFASDHYRNGTDTSIGLVTYNNSTSVKLMIKNSSPGLASAYCSFTYNTDAP